MWKKNASIRKTRENSQNLLNAHGILNLSTKKIYQC